MSCQIFFLKAFSIYLVSILPIYLQAHPHDVELIAASAYSAGCRVQRGFRYATKKAFMEVTTALAVLENALDRCRHEDMRTAEVFAALDFLEVHATQKWPFDRFRR